MKPGLLFATCLLLATLTGCAGLTKSDTNPWLDAKAGPVAENVSGKWASHGNWTANWGEGNFIQDGARFYGYLGSYYVDGSVNGEHMYMALSSGKKVYYTAQLRRNRDGTYAGKVLQGAIIDQRGADEAGISLITLRRVEAR